MNDRTGDGVCDLPARRLAALVREGELSARELLDAHRSRVERLDPQVNAIPTRCWDRAEATAAAHDDHLARTGTTVGPLHGLPMAYKDLLLTEGVRTTFGSPVFADQVPAQSDALAKRMDAAGAVLFGKTNTPELGAGSHTFNPVFGTTRNPWDLTRSAGGSSGGAAAALTCAMVPLADGSDVGGSLRNPPSFCGVVGLRPSPGRVPLTTGIAARERFPAYGPLGRDVADVALLLSALAGPHPSAPWSLPEPGATFAPPLPRPTRPLRVAVSEDLGGLPVDPAVRAVVRAVADVAAELGWAVVEAEPPLDGVDACFETIRAWAYWGSWGRVLGERAAEAKETVRQELADGRAVTGEQLFDALVAETRLVQGAAAFFDDHDLLLTVTSQVPPFPAEWDWVHEIDGVAMHRYTDWMRSCSRITVLGLPALSLPGGFTADGLPVGVQLAARSGADLDLLGAAAALEEALALDLTPPLRRPT